MIVGRQDMKDNENPAAPHNLQQARHAFWKLSESLERLSESATGLKTGQHTAVFDRLYEESAQIRRECEQARQALECHRTEHDC